MVDTHNQNMLQLRLWDGYYNNHIVWLGSKWTQVLDARYKASRPKRDTMGTKGYSYDYLEEQAMIARDFEAQ